jgi:hypothetical protein
LEEQGGSVVMPGGIRTVWVGHELGRIPVSVTITPTLDSDKYWISQWNSTHFELEVNMDKAYDILYFWYIR